MKLTAQVKLQPTQEQYDSLKRTMERANQAANYVSQMAWGARKFGKFDLQKLTYGIIRTQFHLSAQVTIRLLAKVANAYKLDKKVERKFKLIYINKAFYSPITFGRTQSLFKIAYMLK